MKYSDCIHKSVCKYVIVDEVCVGGCNDKYYESTILLEEAVKYLSKGATGKNLGDFLARAKERLQG